MGCLSSSSIGASDVNFPITAAQGLELAAVIIVEGSMGRLGFVASGKQRPDVFAVDLMIAWGLPSGQLRDGGQEVH